MSDRPRPLPRLLALVLTLGLLIPAASADPAQTARRERTETQEYMSPAVAVTPIHPYGAAVCNQGGLAGGNRGCLNFFIRPRERFISIKIVDAAGLAVPGFIQWGEGDLDTWVPFCGETPTPVRIKGTLAVWVYAYRSPNLPPCAGTATAGEVTVTFTARRR